MQYCLFNGIQMCFFTVAVTNKIKNIFCLSVYLSICLSAYLSICLYFYLSNYPFLSLSINILTIYLSIHLYLPTYPFIAHCSFPLSSLSLQQWSGNEGIIEILSLSLQIYFYQSIYHSNHISVWKTLSPEIYI